MSHRDRFNLVCYASDDIWRVWDDVFPFLQKGLDAGSDYVIDDILSGLECAEMQLWTAQDNGQIKAAMVTTLQDEHCLLLVAGGSEVQSWMQWLPVVEQWAKGCGVKEMRIYGRRGWLKVLPGFRERTTEMVKPL